MKNIYKYKLEFIDHQVIKLPIERALDKQVQNEVICLWALVDDALPEKSIEIFCFGTGTRDVAANMKSDLEYISTAQINNFVFHYFIREV